MQKRFLAGLTVAALLGGLASCSLDPEISVALKSDIPSSMTLCVGDTVTLTNTLIPATAIVSLTSSASSVASTTGSTTITAVATGSTTVTLTGTNDGDTLAKTCAVTVVAGPSTTNMVARYTFDNFTSTAVANEVTSGSVNDMVLASYSASSSTDASYLYTPAKIGKGAVYWPNSLLGGTISGAVIGSSGTAVTISAWVNLVKLQWINFVNFTNGTINERFDYPNLTLNTYGNDYGGFSTDSVNSAFANDAAFYTTSDYADDNGWIFLTLVIDGSANTISYYCNGALLITYANSALATDIDAAIAIANGTTTGGKLVFGAQNWGDGESAIDDLRIYNTALDATAIAAMYTAY